MGSNAEVLILSKFSALLKAVLQTKSGRSYHNHLLLSYNSIFCIPA